MSARLTLFWACVACPFCLGCLFFPCLALLSEQMGMCFCSPWPCPFSLGPLLISQRDHSPWIFFSKTWLQQGMLTRSFVSLATEKEKRRYMADRASFLFYGQIHGYSRSLWKLLYFLPARQQVQAVQAVHPGSAVHPSQAAPVSRLRGGACIN